MHDEGRNPPRAGAAVCVAAALWAVWPCGLPADEPKGASSRARIIADHRVPASGEHPRLIVRRGDGLTALKRTATTPWGRKVAARIRQALMLTRKLAIAGRNREVIKEAGFKAAGHGALYLLDADAAAAARARAVVLREIVAYPMRSSLSVMDRISRLHGVAVAYDLCHDAWDEATRRKVRSFLLAEARSLVEKAGDPGGDGMGQPEHVTAWGAAGLAEMAVLADAADAGAAARIATCEKAVLGYIDRHVGAGGFDAHGESVRQVAFASGILPFLRAERLVLGRDFTALEASSSALLAMVHQCLPGAGIAVTGAPTATIDRTGLFALATDLTPAARRPAAAWLLCQLGGETHLGFVRPHHGLYMLAGVGPVTPAAPGSDWPRFVRSDRAKYVSFRTGWKDANEILAVIHNRGLRILGMGSHWASHAGRDAAQYGQDRGAGSLDNVFALNPKRDRRLPSRYWVPAAGEAGTGRKGKTRRMGPPGGGPNAGVLYRGGTVYRIRETCRLTQAQADPSARLGSAAFAFTGRAVRLEPTFTARVIDDLANKPNEWETRPVPEGGPFEGQRVFGVDYTGASGAAALFVVADGLTGVSGAQRVWVMHTAEDLDVTANGATFTIAGEQASLRGTILLPRDAVFEHNRGGPWNFLTVETTGERIEVVMTLQRGPAPKVSATDGGLSAGVKVGKRVVRLEGDEITFGRRAR